MATPHNPVFVCNANRASFNQTKVRRIALIASMATSMKQDRLALNVKWVNEVVHQKEPALSAMLVNFKTEKARQCVSIASMAKSTMQDRLALNVKWVNEVAHHRERASSVKKGPTQIKQDKKHARHVTLDKHPMQPKQRAKSHRTNYLAIAN